MALIAACTGADAPAAGRAPAGESADTLLAVAGTHLFLHREGVGEPMIVIHGGPLLDHGYMVEPLRPLGDDVTLVFYDQRLSGRSDGVVEGASVRMATFVEDVEAIRAALELGRVHVLGHSWGGLLAMKYAAAHPDRVRSLILVSPMPPTAALWQEAEQVLAASLGAEDTAGMGALRASDPLRAGEPAAIEELLRLSFRSQLHEPGRAAALDFAIGEDYGARSRAFGRIMGDLTAYDVRADLRALRVPVLLVYGASERGVSPGIDSLAAVLTDVRVEAVASAGHFAFLEQPAAFVGVVREFLTRVASNER